MEIADALNSGIEVKDITFIPGTVYKTKDISGIYDGILLPSYEEMKADKKKLCRQLYDSVYQYGSLQRKSPPGRLSERSVRGTEPASGAAFHRRDG